MPIVQQGAINTTALLVPDLFVQIVPPQVLLNGVPTNILGIVGTAAWGPVNSPVVAGGPSDAARLFGAMQARKHDLGTAVYAAALQGASNFRLVRATDGTDAAASGILPQGGVGGAAVVAGGTGYAVGNTVTLPGGAVLTVATVSSGAILTVTVATPGSYASVPPNPVAQSATNGSGTGGTFNLTFPAGVAFTAKYTGSLGNGLSVNIGAGSGSTNGAPTYKLAVNLPGQLSEVFDNIGGTGNALFINMANAVNQGVGGLRGPSQLVVATAGAGTLAPAVASVSLSGGTDGAGGVTSATLAGLDTAPRKGMYALRSTGASVAMLADADDSTQWTLQAAYGLSEGTYMIAASPAGDTIAGFASTLSGAGIDSYAIKVMFGDWVRIYDPVGGVTRLVSPQGFEAGKLSALSPEQSSLNKIMNGIVATQKTAQNQQYSNAELQAIAQARGEVITNPVPGGGYFGARLGRNTSSNAAVNGDNYTRLTNYLAATLDAGMGLYIGLVQSETVRERARATLDGFLQNMAQQGMIEDWQVVLDDSNNPPTRVALGYMQADVRVRYLSIISYFLINMEGGQTTTILRTSQPA